ncbi:alpha/beta-hydrolase [Schizopora paradoxa]|uniref:Alpha/beta-hydrolase n=1 Tax=Schizopora paradoxa TaxID=27342 RepID=A0A0H2R2X3_9AGAM|nr:alpha/beta-hydrolase [Schizopora paradoxa]
MARIILTLVFSTLFYLTTAIPSPELVDRASITTLSSDTVDSYKPYAFYSSTAYCSPESIMNWDCGENCNANPHFRPNKTGGDGIRAPFWYMGYDSILNTIIISHHGAAPGEMQKSLHLESNGSNRLSSLNIAGSNFTTLFKPLFDGAPDDIRVHANISTTQLFTASDIFLEWEYAAADERPTITFVDHSSGAALSLLDAVYFALQFPYITDLSPPWTKVKFVGYGLPRVGNQAFADFVDEHITVVDDGKGFVRINNMKDPVPINPSRALGYVHPSGEIHIQASGEWDTCPGQDNPDSQCIRGAVQNDANGNKPDNYCPYDGVMMGC